MKPRPKYLLIVFALAGDSTITSDRAICLYVPRSSAAKSNFALKSVRLRLNGAPYTSYLLSRRRLQEDFQELLTR